MAPAHRVADNDHEHLDPRRIPQFMLFFGKLHHRLDGKIAQEIRAKAGISASSRATLASMGMLASSSCMPSRIPSSVDTIAGYRPDIFSSPSPMLEHACLS